MDISPVKLHVNPGRILGLRDRMIYGQFVEHFHRQVYGGLYEPGHPLADGDGLRSDVLAALQRLRIPILRWPGGCFVSAYHWKDAVGSRRTPTFDKAWRVEESGRFGTDEYIGLCRKLGCEPYICTNAGTGTAEEMSDWVEYCNLESEGRYAKWRIENGHQPPHAVRYWSIGNENYTEWEIGSKSAPEWGRLVLEAAKMMKRVDPTIQLSAAALTDVNWNLNLLQHAGPFLDWLSVHEYWDPLYHENNCAGYEEVLACTADIGHSVREVEGLLSALGLEKRIRIAFDEWNLRGWHHPNIHCMYQGRTREEYLTPRDQNDDNRQYTMADAVFTACFLNMCHRHCNIVGMANFAPVLNTRGCIYTHPGGVVLRSTFHVFEAYVHRMGNQVVDAWAEGMPRLTVQSKTGDSVTVDVLDIAATSFSGGQGLALALVNKHAAEPLSIELDIPAGGDMALTTVNGMHPDAYNDVGHQGVAATTRTLGPYKRGQLLHLEPHSVNILTVEA